VCPSLCLLMLASGGLGSSPCRVKLQVLFVERTMQCSEHCRAVKPSQRCELSVIPSHVDHYSCRLIVYFLLSPVLCCLARSLFVHRGSIGAQLAS